MEHTNIRGNKCWQNDNLGIIKRLRKEWRREIPFFDQRIQFHCLPVISKILMPKMKTICSHNRCAKIRSTTRHGMLHVTRPKNVQCNLPSLHSFPQIFHFFAFRYRMTFSWCIYLSIFLGTGIMNPTKIWMSGEDIIEIIIRCFFH